jgi:GTPase
MLVDNIKLIVKGGMGGNGSGHLRRDGQTAKGGPDGGDGGDGGNIYFQGSHNITDLREFRYKKKIVAEDGTHGKKQNMHGKSAEDLTLYMPLGTRVTNRQTKEAFEITDTEHPVLVVAGGKGGSGNTAFKSATNQTPRNFELGASGEEKELFLELRLIAEVGLIGLPNAGKSSLLTVLTHATPKIGNYPFTTLEPTIGMFGTHPIADIPGLIRGASSGKGLGLDFLKHIEKTKILLHCIDVTETSPMGAYETIRTELKQFDPKMLEKPEYIVLTKIDLADPMLIARVSRSFSRKHKHVLTSSAYDPSQVIILKEQLEAIL